MALVEAAAEARVEPELVARVEIVRHLDVRGLGDEQAGPRRLAGRPHRVALVVAVDVGPQVDMKAAHRVPGD